MDAQRTEAHLLATKQHLELHRDHWVLVRPLPNAEPMILRRRDIQQVYELNWKTR